MIDIGAAYRAVVTSGSSATTTIRAAEAERTQQVVVRGVLLANPTTAAATLRLRVGNTDALVLRAAANTTEMFPVPFFLAVPPGQSLTLVVEGAAGAFGLAVIT